MNIWFEYPYALLLLALLICFYRCKKESLAIYFSHIHLLPKSWFKRDIFAPALFLLLVLALSFPFLYDYEKRPPKKGRDLVLVLDASGSMGFDLKNSSKFKTLIELSKKFVDRRFDDNIGVVVFGAFAYTASPITYDLKALKFILDYIEVGIAGNSTAIGDALAEAVKSIKKSGSKKRVIILFTDGKQNAGKISVKDAVLMAKKERIKIYTVGIGEDFDKNLLKRVAKESGGEFFAARDEESLKEIFSKLNSIEPSPVRSGIYENKKPLYWIFSLLALTLIAFRIKRLV